MAKVESMKGLQIFIKKLRAAATADQRETIVNAEFSKIRKCLGGSSRVSSYDKKKCLWKLLYAYMMGYPVDFGHKQAADLIPSDKYDEKQVGYQALTILLNENDDFMTLLVNNVIKDLESTIEPFQALALCFAGAVAGQEMAMAILQPVTKILMNERISDAVRKKAALCLLRLFRKLPIDAGIITPDVWAPNLKTLLGNKSLGFKLSVMGLVNGILERDDAGYESLQPSIAGVLKAIIVPGSVPKDYAYYGMPMPWLQCKCLRALLHFPPPEDAALAKALGETLAYIVDKHAPAKVANLTNMQNAVLIEAVRLVLHLQLEQLLAKCIGKVVALVQSPEPNARYVALEAMSRLALVPEMGAAIKDALPHIQECLKDPDASIRKRAVAVLFMICEADSAPAIVDVLLAHVKVCDPTMKSDLVLKVAILAERFAPSIEWYTDTVTTLMVTGADEVNAEIWQRVVQLVTNNEDMQKHSVQNVLGHMDDGTMSVPLINTAGYVLAEYADALKASHTGLDIFKILMTRFDSSPKTTRHLLLTSAIKLRARFPDDAELKAAVEDLFEPLLRSQDAEMQQRALEYHALSGLTPHECQAIFGTMPPWPDGHSILQRLEDRNAAPPDAETGAARPTLADAAAASQQTVAIDLGAAPSGSVPAELPASPHSPGVSGAISHSAAPSQELPPPAPPAAPAAFDLLGLESPVSAAARDGPADLLAPAAAPADDLFGLSAGHDAPLYAAAPAPADDFFGAAVHASVPAGGVFGEPHAVAADSYLSAPSHSAGSAVYGTYGSGQEPRSSPHAPPSPPAAAHAPSAAPSAHAPAAHAAPPAGAAVLINHTKLLIEGKGVASENWALQVGIMAQVQGCQSFVTLYLGNKTSAPISRLSVAPPPPTLGAAVDVLLQSEVPDVLPPQQQVQIAVLVTCHAPFAAAPEVLISYAVGAEVLHESVAIPLLAPKFSVPHAGIAGPEFFAFWQAVPMQQPAGRAAQMVRLSSPKDPLQVAANLEALGLSGGPGRIDPNPINFAGAAHFLHSSIHGAPAAQLVLTRVEINPLDLAQLQVTVVSEYPVLSAAFLDWIVIGLQYWSS